MGEEYDSGFASLTGLLDDIPTASESFSFELPENLKKNIFSDKRQKWKSADILARCDFKLCPKITKRGDVWFFSIWQKSVKGKTLVDIKADDSEVPHFANSISDFILEVLGNCFDPSQWAIVTTPFRRHKTNNFADRVCTAIAEIIKIPYIREAAKCRTRQRINAIFDPGNIPQQKCLIVVDDIVTTGSTFKAMRELLRSHGKTTFFFTGINNKL